MLTAAHKFGFEKEVQLHSRLEAALEEPITKNNPRYEQYDYQSAYWNIELKSRRATDKFGRPLLPTTNKTWLLPTSKKPKNDDKETVFFYFFEADKSLWYITYDEDLFNTFAVDCPGWHPTQQQHWFVPAECWTLLEN